jgi:luciferase family oxidoreductase group 1
MSFRLSLLDKSPIPPGASAAQALAATVRLAQRADALGYHRFWLAEHHQSPALAGAAPEVLLGHLLALTRRLRIGSGGVMLQHYSPYKVAEQFKVLAALAPGRVDLGVGKAPGGLPLSTRALQARHDAGRPAGFDSLLADLDGFLRDALPEGHALQGAVATPDPSELPQRILLGGSPDSALLAAQHGWQFCYAGHFNGDPEALARSVDVYREVTGRAPLLALYAFAADTAEAAAAAVGALRLIRLTLPHPVTGDWATGQQVNLPSLQAAAEFARQAGAADYRTEERRPHVVSGTGAQVRAALRTLQQRWGIEEFVIDIPVPGFAERQRAVELLSPLDLDAAAPVAEPVIHA